MLEPHTRFVPNWHLDAICTHLEAVTTGQIRNLVINIPPGFSKSLTTCVFWPTWVWAYRPESRWLFSSYAEQLAVRDCVKARRLMQSDWYQTRWGRVFQFTSDQNEKTKYENDRTGFRRSTSIKSATGERADFVVTDDPHNIGKAESALERHSVLIAWDEVMSQRGADPQTSRRVIIMQRLHEQDLSGHVLEQGGYEHLCLPMEYEGKPCITVLGQQDPRSTEGELLCPARFPPEAVADGKLRLGIYGAAGQYQQRPAPRGGGMFKREWFEIVDAIPAQAIRRARAWDKAGTEEGGKYTAGVRVSLHAGIAYVEHVRRGQWSAATREPIIKQTAQLDAQECGGPTAVHVLLEQEPGSGGKESAEYTTRNLTGYIVKARPATGDKFVRAGPLAAAAQAGNVKLLHGPWNAAFLDELEVAGPGARYLDQMDAAAAAFSYVALEWSETSVPVVSPPRFGGPSYWSRGG